MGGCGSGCVCVWGGGGRVREGERERERGGNMVKKTLFQVIFLKFCLNFQEIKILLLLLLNHNTNDKTRFYAA